MDLKTRFLAPLVLSLFILSLHAQITVDSALTGKLHHLFPMKA
jgi:hypothetical protein